MFLYQGPPKSISVQSISHSGSHRRLEEIVGSTTRHHGLAGTWAWVELQALKIVSNRDKHKKDKKVGYAQGVFQVLVNLHDCGLVTTAVAVIRGGKYRNDVSVLTPVVALHDQLVGSGDQSQAVVVVEGFADVLTKRVTSTSWAYAPAASVVGVTPEQVAHGTLVGHLLNSVESADVVESVNAR